MLPNPKRLNISAGLPDPDAHSPPGVASNQLPPPHQQNSSSSSLPARAAALRARAAPRDSNQTPPTTRHVTWGPAPTNGDWLNPHHVIATSPRLLGNMAAPIWGVMDVWVREAGKRWESLGALAAKSFCSAAAASTPLSARQLAERLRSQKQEQKAKESVSSGRAIILHLEAVGGLSLLTLIVGKWERRVSVDSTPTKLETEYCVCGDSGTLIIQERKSFFFLLY